MNGGDDEGARQRLSVVVPTRNRARLLARCLDTVASALQPGDELIVADSSSVTSEVEALAAAHGAILVRCSRAGASYQRNVGADAAGHDIVAFIDDDVRVSPEWGTAVMEAFAQHPEAMFITGRLDVPPEQGGYGRPVSIKAELEPAPLTPSTRGTLGHSANMAIRRAALERVAGFDERLGPGALFRAAEDGDLIDRLFAAGYEGRYEPGVLGWHDQWRTRPQLVKLEWSYGIGTGARLLRLARSNRTRARMVAGDYLWKSGLRPLPSNLRRRNEFEVLYTLARVAGAAYGALMATITRFASRRPRSDR